MASTRSPLLELCAELRNEIYRYALLDESKLRLNEMFHTTPLDENQPKTDVKRNNLRPRMALLQTCRQIRQEAIGIFYAENRFEFLLSVENYTQLMQWLDMIGPQARRITRMCVQVYYVQAFLDYVAALRLRNRFAASREARNAITLEIRSGKVRFYQQWQMVLTEMAKSMCLAGLKTNAVRYPRNIIQDTGMDEKRVFLQYLKKQMGAIKSGEGVKNGSSDLQDFVTAARRRFGAQQE